MSAFARHSLMGALTVAFGIVGIFQICLAADTQSMASAQNETAPAAQHAKGPLEILLSQHQQRTRQNVSVQSAGAQGVSGSSQAKAATPSAALPAVATPPLDVQTNAPLGTATDARRDAAATTSANPVRAPVSLQAPSLERGLPAVSNQSKALVQPTSNGAEGD
jgi:hypothetical protein